jgi:DNA-binding GntR family transcriptional regulator
MSVRRLANSRAGAPSETRAPKRRGAALSKIAPQPTARVERNDFTSRPRPRLTRRTLQDNVYDYLREALMTGEFSPGQRLTVRGIAADIGTSIMPVREALRRLTSEGALEPLSTGAIRVPVFDLPKLQDLTELRLAVEGLAARRAATRMTGDDFKTLERCDREVQLAIASGDFVEEAKANEHFHFTIYRAAQSTDLLRIIESLWLQIGPYLTWLFKQGKWPARSHGTRAFRYHKDIESALRRRDGDQAETALRADLMTAAEVLFEFVRNLPVG